VSITKPVDEISIFSDEGFVLESEQEKNRKKVKKIKNNFIYK